VSIDLRSLVADGEVVGRVGNDPDGITIAGVELGYAESTTTQGSITAAGLANRIDVTGLTITITVGTRPIVVEGFVGQATNDTTDRGVGLAIVEGTTVLNVAIVTLSLGTAYGTLNPKVRLAPSAGSHTYKLMTWRIVGGTASLDASATAPNWIQAVEV